MRKYIKDRLVEMHRTCGTDKYGQVSIFNFGIYSLFGEKAEEAAVYGEKHGLFSLSTYGATYGHYKAIASISDTEIKEACREALNNNENYKRNLNSW